MRIHLRALILLVLQLGAARLGLHVGKLGRAVAARHRVQIRVGEGGGGSVHKEPSAALNETGPYGAPPLKVDPSLQLKTQPTSLG